MKRSRSKVSKLTGRRASTRNVGASKAPTIFPLRGPSQYVSRVSVTPDRAFVKLRYLEPPYQTGNLTGAATYVDKYAINSIYDPYLGAGGGQPSGTAKMFAQYQFCRVWASTIHFRVTRNEHQSDSPYEMALVPISYGGTPTPPSTFSQYVEQPYSIYKEGVSVYADQAHTLSMRMETTKLGGVVPYSLANATWYHNNAANATYTHEWHCVVQQANAAVNNTSLQISVEIEYECEFFLRTSNSASLLDKVLEDSITSGRLEEIKKSLAGEVIKTPHLRISTDSKDEVLEPGDIVNIGRFRSLPIKSLSGPPITSVSTSSKVAVVTTTTSPSTRSTLTR